MPTPFTTPSGKTRLERIMAYGDADVGKTHLLWRLARWHHKRGSDAHFWGICTPGNDWSPFEQGEFADLDNVTYEHVTDMQDYLDVYTKKILPQAKKRKGRDWLCVDVQGDAWEAAQDEWGQREWGTSVGAQWNTRGGQHPVAGDYGGGWGSIKARYNDWANRKLATFPGHLLSLYWDKRMPFEEKPEDADLWGLFGPVGRMPQGNPHDYKRYPTIVHLGVNSKNQRVWRTVRDKQRDGRLGKLKQVKQAGKDPRILSIPESNTGDLLRSYLVPIAGWRL